jgi:hypothetical protein
VTLKPSHMALCLVLLVALVLLLGSGGIALFVVICLAMLGAMLWMMMGGFGHKGS